MTRLRANAASMTAFGLILFLTAASWHFYAKAEQQAQFSRILTSVLEETETAVVIVDGDTGKIDYWSRGAEKVFGWRANEAVGRGLELIIPTSLRDTHKRTASEAVESNPTSPITKLVRCSANYRNEDGEVFEGHQDIVLTTRVHRLGERVKLIALINRDRDVDTTGVVSQISQLASSKGMESRISAIERRMDLFESIVKDGAVNVRIKGGVPAEIIDDVAFDEASQLEIASRFVAKYERKMDHGE